MARSTITSAMRSPRSLAGFSAVAIRTRDSGRASFGHSATPASTARPGFSIAAHLDPDVLIVDEALAVGDAEFQRRALDRVRELLGAGIPTLVVSHQLDVIASLCTHALLLDRGAVVAQGEPGDCIA